MRNLIVEYASCNVNLDLFTIEIDEESSSNDLDNYLDIPEDNCVFTLTSTSFENIDGLPLSHPQLIDWDQEGPLQLDTFENDDGFIDYLGIQDDLRLGTIKWGTL